MGVIVLIKFIHTGNLEEIYIRQIYKNNLDDRLKSLNLAINTIRRII